MRKYDSYNDSGVEWIGEIPNHWKKLKPWTLFQPEKRVPLEGDNIVTCFRDGVVTLRRKRREDGFTISLKEIGYQRILVGDLVVHEMDGFEGSIGVSDSDGKSTPVYTVISEGYNHNNRYWMYLLREMSRSKFIESLSKSIRERTTEFRWNTWKTQFFINPPLSEQSQIVQFLDEKTSLIDSLIEKTKRKIELLKEERTSLINHTVTKGLNPNVEMKDSGVEWIGEIPRGWKISKLKYDSSTPVQYGINISGDKYVEEGIRFIRITDISESGDLNPNDGKYLVPEDVPNEFLLRKFDVLFCRSGHTVGKTYLHTSDGLFSSGGYLVRFNFRNYTESKFIFYLSKTHFYWDWININTVVSTIENVNGDKYQNFIYPKPPLSEQEEIVHFLDEKTSTIDKTIELEGKRIDYLKEYRQSLISEVVTGKRKVVD